MLRFPEDALGCQWVKNLGRFGDVQLFFSIFLHDMFNPQGALVPCLYVIFFPVSLLVSGMNSEDDGRSYRPTPRYLQNLCSRVEVFVGDPQDKS